MTSQSTITQQCKGHAWQTQPANGVLAQDTATAEGFSAYAQKKGQCLTTHGSKEREIGNHVSSFHSIFGQPHSLIIWILIAAGVIFALLGESVDVIAVVLLNAIIVFFQEFNVEKPQHKTLEDDRSPQHAATRNSVNGSGGAICLIGQQPAD